MSLIRSLAKTVFAGADLMMPSPAGPRVLIFHQVGAGLGRQMEVTIDQFRRQLDWLEANREVVSLEEALRRWREPDSSRLVVITFDDGYADTHSTAFPMMKERGLPFTLYLTTEPIESGTPLSPEAGALPLDWEQIDSMLASGLVTIGAHTHRHLDLRTTSAPETVADLDRSNELIESRLGIAPQHFAYPYGYWSEQADAVVRSRYQSAVLGGSPKPPARPDPYRIHRYPVQLSDGFVFFERRLSGGLVMEEKVRRAMKGYHGP